LATGKEWVWSKGVAAERGVSRQVVIAEEEVRSAVEIVPARAGNNIDRSTAMPVERSKLALLI
jgi:hypothetical protein